MPRFKLNCSWTMFGFYEVEASSREKALSKVQYTDFPNNATLDEESFIVDSVEEGAEID